MKKINLLLFAFAFFISSHAEASHIFATNITCTYAGAANSYHVTYKMYRDCSGIPAPTVVPLCYSSASLAFGSTVDLYPIAGTGQQVTLAPCYLPGAVTSCNGGSAIGLQEYVYEGLLVLPAAAVDWMFGYEECCHTGNITNLMGNPGSYLYTKLDNLNYPTNSTPDFLHPAWAQYCIGSSATHEFTATDIDGDSLVYTFDNCLDASFGCPYIPFTLTYIAPYTASNPLSSSSPISLNSATGEMSFTPDIIQYAEVAITLSEYRNGQLISVTHREDLIASINGVLGEDDILGKVYHDANTNGVYDAGEAGMNGQIIEVTPGSYYFSTNSLGDYTAQVPIDNYTITVHNNYPWYYYSPASHTANFTAFGQTDANNDFGFGAYINVQDLKVTATGNNVRPGFASDIYVTAKNMGTVTTNATVKLMLDPAFTYLSAIPTPTSVTGNLISWNIPAMQMLQSENFTVSVDVPLLPIGTILHSYADVLPLVGDTIPDDNTDSLDQELVNSCDPNEKKVFPGDYITTTQINNGLFLEYTVFFQNVGTAPAININITDSLDSNFDIGTFELLSTSHTCSWNMEGVGILHFNFANIYLPDSLANEPASHGFIKYRVKPKNNLYNGQKLVNYAYIYFDGNAPIATNYTSTHVFNTTGITKIEKENGVAIYPNPADDRITIAKTNNQSVIKEVSVVSLLGNIVLTTASSGQLHEKSIQLDVSVVASGVYLLRVKTGDSTLIKKIVIE